MGTSTGARRGGNMLSGQVKGRTMFLVVTSLCNFFNSVTCTHQRNKWLI